MIFWIYFVLVVENNFLFTSIDANANRSIHSRNLKCCPYLSW